MVIVGTTMEESREQILQKVDLLCLFLSNVSQNFPAGNDGGIMMLEAQKLTKKLTLMSFFCAARNTY